MPRRAKIKTERIVRSLGKDWGKAVQRQVMKAAVAQARVHLRSGKSGGKDEVEAVVALNRLGIGGYRRGPLGSVLGVLQPLAAHADELGCRLLEGHRLSAGKARVSASRFAVLDRVYVPFQKPLAVGGFTPDLSKADLAERTQAHFSGFAL
jgi:hypothetical protein